MRHLRDAPLLVYASRASVSPDGAFIAWTQSTDDRLWGAIQAQQPVAVVMHYGGRWYTGEGVPDQISGTGVRLTGSNAKRLGRFSAWILRRSIRVALEGR